MSELVPAETHPAHSPDASRWTEGLALVGQWLAETSGNTRTTYADAIGFPYHPVTGSFRDTSLLRNGVTWLAWCARNGVHLLDAKRLHVLAWIETVNASRHPETGEPLSKRSRAQMVSVASSFYTWAVHEGHTEINPVAAVNRKKQGLGTSKDKSPTRSLSKAEAHAVIKAADNDPVEAVRLRSTAIIALLFEVGPRVSEICNATLADMYVQDGRRVLHVELKGKKDHYFALPPSVCRRIDAYLASRKDMELLPARRGQVSASTTPLFATANGKPMHRAEVLALVKRIAKLSGIDRPESVHPHVGRHTYITEARRQGHATSAIKNSVGHEYESTTDRYGVHILNLENSPAYGVAEAFEQELNERGEK